jgi:Outer membrane protein beta-barrel domain
MKKIFSLLALAFIFINIQAQGFKLGIKAGANFTTNTSASFKENYQGGFQAGVFGRVKASDIIGVQVEGLVGNVTLKLAPTAAGFRSGLTQLKATYVHIPILLNISPVKLLSLQVGPQIGMTVAQTSNALQNGQDALKKNDFNMLSGIQLNLPKLSIYGRYSFGLSDIRNITSSIDQWKSKMLQAGIGISL